MELSTLLLVRFDTFVKFVTSFWRRYWTLAFYLVNCV